MTNLYGRPPRSKWYQPSNLILVAGGTLIAYGLGMSLGDIAERIPHIQEGISNLCKLITGLPFREVDIGGALGLTAAVRGFTTSGIKRNRKTGRLKDICIYPVHCIPFEGCVEENHLEVKVRL